MPNCLRPECPRDRPECRMNLDGLCFDARNVGDGCPNVARGESAPKTQETSPTEQDAALNKAVISPLT